MIILLGIYTGIFTPTEAAAICVVYASFLGIAVYRTLSVKNYFNVVRETVVDAGPICILLAVSTFFGSALIRANVPQQLVASLMSVVHSKWIFWLLFNLSFLVIGMFMETVSAITILTPIVFPMAVAYGINPIHFGIVMVFNLMIGVISPPFGTCLFAVSKVGRVSMSRLIKSLVPWYIVLCAALTILVLFPQISILLPSMMSIGK